MFPLEFRGEVNRQAKRQIRRFQRPHAGLKPSSKKRPRISTNDLYCQTLELLTYIFAADSMGLHSLVFT